MALFEGGHVYAAYPSARLGFTLFIAATLHAALVLGLGFTLPQMAPLRDSLEITLAAFNDEKAPDQADFLAQHNQQGSGTQEEKAAPTTTDTTPFQSDEVNTVKMPKGQQQTEEQSEQPVLTTSSGRTKSARNLPTPEQKPPTTPDFDSSELSAQIASLTAELADAQQAYAKRPRRHQVTSASTRSDKAAWYMYDWVKKVERIGNLNYPEEARRLRIYGQLRLLVVVKRDGSLLAVQILQSSGQKVLDDAAKRIVRLSAPFPPFSGALADSTDELEIIRTWRFERSDKLSSSQ
ncbi:energy transducer TonB [Ventosimonas gracilis]|uniref:Energy transducer TonB n=1 Tax=Ventosimonas gracilis TaxID=1680762 RepID=A0A139SIA7_9GAMM|nr:energy transducer TonB [Ventosimonas gracilis]KXU34276.1 energy transducer TonB [Ventosimonas gracilis]